MTILKCPIARNNKWRIQTLKNLSFLLDKWFHFVLYNFGLLDTLQSVFIVRFIFDMENNTELAFS